MHSRSADPRRGGVPQDPSIPRYQKKKKSNEGKRASPRVSIFVFPPLGGKKRGEEFFSPEKKKKEAVLLESGGQRKRRKGYFAEGQRRSSSEKAIPFVKERGAHVVFVKKKKGSTLGRKGGRNRSSRHLLLLKRAGLSLPRRKKEGKKGKGLTALSSLPLCRKRVLRPKGRKVCPIQFSQGGGSSYREKKKKVPGISAGLPEGGLSKEGNPPSFTHIHIFSPRERGVSFWRSPDHFTPLVPEKKEKEGLYLPGGGKEDSWFRKPFLVAGKEGEGGLRLWKKRKKGLNWFKGPGIPPLSKEGRRNSIGGNQITLARVRVFGKRRGNRTDLEKKGRKIRTVSRKQTSLFGQARKRNLSYLTRICQGRRKMVDTVPGRKIHQRKKKKGILSFAEVHWLSPRGKKKEKRGERRNRVFPLPGKEPARSSLSAGASSLHGKGSTIVRRENEDQAHQEESTLRKRKKTGPYRELTADRGESRKEGASIKKKKKTWTRTRFCSRVTPKKLSTTMRKKRSSSEEGKGGAAWASVPLTWDWSDWAEGRGETRTSPSEGRGVT